MEPDEIRCARPDEVTALEALQRRSSLDGEMYRAVLLAHPDAIEVPTEYVVAGRVRVAVVGGAVVGFATLLPGDAGACELDAMFVDPPWMRRGIGLRLIDDAVAMARAEGFSRMEVTANPQALAFYGRAGFVTVSEAQTQFGPAPRMVRELDATT